MATTLQANGKASLTWTVTKTADVGNSSNQSGLSVTNTLTAGTGASQADLLYIESITIAASGNKQYDLSGTLTNVFGDACVFARIKSCMIVPQSANTASGFTVGGGSDGAGTAAFIGWNGAAANKIKVDATGAFWMFRSDATAWAVTATTADILRIDNLDGTNAILLNVAIVGCSA